jgi:hypothetical protein
VLFNFSLPSAKYESYKNTFERSARSVQLGFIAEDIEVTTGTGEQRSKKP